MKFFDEYNMEPQIAQITQKEFITKNPQIPLC